MVCGWNRRDGSARAAFDISSICVGEARPLLQAIRTRVETTDSRLSARPESVAATIAHEAGRYSTVLELIALRAGLALFLSLVGIYGVAASAAAQRTQEIGCASPRKAPWSVLRDS